MINSSMVIAHPACAILNRVPTTKLASGGQCRGSGVPLFQGRPLDLAATNSEARAVKSGHLADCEHMDA